MLIYSGEGGGGAEKKYGGEGHKNMVLPRGGGAIKTYTKLHTKRGGPTFCTPCKRTLRKKLMQKSLKQAPQLTAEIREEVINFYREDILKTQDLIKRDLSSWLQKD